MTTGINQSKTPAKHVSCKRKCKFDGNSNHKWNNNKCRYECKNPKEHHVCDKDYIWNPDTCSCKNGKCLASIIDDSVTMCDEIINTTKSVRTNFNEER